MPALRPVHYSALVKVFERDGFAFSRQSGDHLIFTKAGKYGEAGINRPLVIPAYHEVPIFIIKNLIRTAGMSRERYFELLAGG